MRFSELKFFAVLLAVLTCSQSTAMAQKNQPVRVVETVWGFDGRVVTGQFTPLSILIDNLSDQPIEAVARLRHIAGMVNAVGGEMTQPVFLGPNSRRWLQFYPYISGQSASWHLDLITEDRTYTFDPMDQPRSVFERNFRNEEKDAEQSMPAVILDPPGMVNRLPTTIKHMPSEIFPPYSTATAGLYALFLDHVPDWETPRQEALLSWLKLGGRLHLLLDENNQTLQFSGPLSPLNEPFPEFQVGNGTVTRHDMQRAALTIQIVTPVVTPPGLTEVLNEETVETQPGSSNALQTNNPFDEGEIFAWLRELTQPDHSWVLIFLLSMFYVGLIFPGCWILSKQRNLHFLVTYGAIAGLATVFSLIFLFIGQRGYGESTSLHTLAIAKAEDETHWSTLQYTTIFVTSGDRYTLEEKDRQTLFASGSADERIDATMSSGNTARYDGSIPPFSSQSVVSRRRLVADNWGLSIVSFVQNGEDLSELTMSVNKQIPSGSDVKYFAIHGTKIYSMSMDAAKGQLRCENASGNLINFCQPVQEQDPQYTNRLTPGGFAGPAYQETLESPAEERFRMALPRMVERSIEDDFFDGVRRFRMPVGKIRLLVYAPVPAAFDLPFSAEVKRGGRILYVKDLSLETARE